LEIPQWLIWIGGVVGTFLSLIGAAKLVEVGQARRYAKQDRQQAIDDTNEGKRIDADQEALKIILSRLNAVEADLKQVHAAHNALMVRNAQLESDAKHAEKERDEQAKEIKSLRERNHTLAGEIQSRDLKLATLEARIVQLEAMLAQYQNGRTG
jgi:chromosome segregation ATPase